MGVKLNLNRILCCVVLFHLVVLYLIETSSVLNDEVTPISSDASLVPRSTTQLSRLKSYDPSNHPVIQTFSTETHKLRVGLIVDENQPKGEGKHIMYDGIQGSDVMQLIIVHDVNLVNTNVLEKVDLWIIDNVCVGMAMHEQDNATGHAFLSFLFHTQSTPILIVDFEDDASWKYGYIDTHNATLKPHVRIAQRSIVIHRRWDIHHGSIQYGKIRRNRGTQGGPTLHISYCVRNDVVAEIERQGLSGNSCPLNSSRTIDVAHLWNVNDTANYAMYRSHVSRLVQNITSNTNITTMTDLQGPRAHAGRRSVSPLYISTLLSSKIVVVTQRDEWEDSYRLFEALAGGAMVLADYMVTPPRGLVNGSHLVFFKSLQALRDLIVYYLVHHDERIAIAQHGRHEAMTNHRAWHRMEEIIFGKVLTTIH